MRDDDRYLQERDGRWHYVRRVPAGVADLDRRGMVRRALKTDSLETARRRRDVCEEADDLYWSSLVTDTDAGATQARYKAAVRRALALNLTYAPARDLAAEAPAAELVARVDAAWGNGGPVRQDAEAALGGAARPRALLSEALDVFYSKISRDQVKHKSPGQLKAWKKTKNRAVSLFVEIVGDKPIEEITRADAQAVYEALLDRVAPEAGEPTLAGTTAKRAMGNLRKLHKDYFTWLGDGDRDNPFRDLTFRNEHRRDVPPFETDWITDRILRPGAFGGLNRQAKLIALAMVETGARPSEIAGLTADTIRTDAAVPHVEIRPSPVREIKNGASRRRIPLVGVSLAALTAAPDGFPDYRDRSAALSACLMKCFRVNGLFPTPAHRVYSLRHSFEKRMAEAGLDYGLRCILMGHATSRPAYGDGGALDYRRDELLKIALDYPQGLL